MGLPFLTRSISHIRLKLFTFFMYGPLALFLPFLPLFLKERGFSPSDIGLLLTIGPIVALLSNPFWGYISDRLQNLKLILLILMTGALAASQFLFHVGPFWAVFVSMMVFYFFYNSMNPINTSQVLQTIEHSNERFGSIRIWGSLGYSAVVLSSGPILDAVGIDQLGWAYGTAMVTAIVFGLFLKPTKARENKPRVTVTFRGTLRSLLQGRFAVFLASSLLIFIPNGFTALYLPLYLEELGGTTTSIGWSMFVAALLEVPLFLLLDRLSKPNLRSMVNLLLFATAVFSVRWLLMGFAQTPIHIILIQFLHCLSFGFYIYTAAQVVEYLTEKQMRASGQTMYALVQSALSYAIAGAVGGYLYEAIGPRTVYWIGAGLTLLGGVAMLAMRLTLRLDSKPNAEDASDPGVPAGSGGRAVPGK